MKWIEIAKSEINDWNNKLKSTNASFFQYPYYTSGYKNFIFSKAVYLKLVDDVNREIGFCCIMKIQFLFLKIGLLIRGPVLFKDCLDTKGAISLLKEYARRKNFTFLRINHAEQIIESALSCDKEFQRKDYFPSYKGSQQYDLLVYKRPEDQLLKSFRDDCRNKIRFQKELNYQYKKNSTEEDLKRVYNLFQSLGAEKKFSYRPFSSYKEIFFKGIKHDLCSVYTAELNNELICAAFIVKDGISYTYLSGALRLNGIKPKFSPANNLHYLIMQDCFYKDEKIKYNLSYSPPESGVYMFKTSFKPTEEIKPSFYTFIINKKLSDAILKLQEGNLSKVRRRLRNLIRIFKP